MITFTIKTSVIRILNKITKAFMIGFIAFYAGSISIPIYSLKIDNAKYDQCYVNDSLGGDASDCGYDDYCFRGLRIKQCDYADEPEFYAPRKTLAKRIG